MKYSAGVYANAFLEVLDVVDKKEEETTVKNFIHLLERNGDLQNYEKISLEIEKLMAKKEGGKFISMEIADKNGAGAKKLTNLFSKKDVVKVSVLPELVAGTRILIDQEREWDFSFKRRLKDLFEK